MIKLSICIPTYNRGKFLRSNLLSIYDQIDDNDSVEIIVSDNCSTDDTSEVVKPYLSKTNFLYNKQTENFGAFANILKTAGEYASGEFCWIIGDDDFLLPNAIKNVLHILATNDIDFIYAKVKEIDITEYYKYPQPFYTGMINDEDSRLKFQLLDKWEELLRPGYSIIYMGELMASIFRRSIWITYRLSETNATDLVSLNTTYPHSVVLANTFVGKKAAYLETLSILALAGTRDWWNQLGYIIMVHVKDLLALYKSKGVSNEIMQACYDSFIDMSVPFAIKFLFKQDSVNREKVFLKIYYKEMLRINAKRTLIKTYHEVSNSIKNKFNQYKSGLKRRAKALIKKPLKSEYDLNIESFKDNKVDLPANFRINGIIKIVNEGYITIGENFKANSGESYNMIGGDVILRLITAKKNAEIKIGCNVGMSNCTLVCWHSITIQDNVLIGGGVRIWDTNFHSLDPLIRVTDYDYDVKTAPVLIKEHAFIGGGSIILKGVTIGRGSIIAAGSVVIKDIPDNVMAGGNPCRVIKSLN